MKNMCAHRLHNELLKKLNRSSIHVTPFKVELSHPLQMWRITSTNPALHLIIPTIIILLHYHFISLLNSGYKIYAKIITQRFKTILEAILLEERNGFRTGRSCTDNVFTIKQTIETRREFNLETHIAFLDLEKAFDRVNWNQLWQILNKRGIPYHLIEVIKSLYKNTSVKIDTGCKILEKIYINQGVRQGCNLSLALFNIYIDDLLRNWKHKADTGIKLKRNIYLNTLHLQTIK